MASRVAVIALCLLASISTTLAATGPPPAPSPLAQELAAAATIEQGLYAAILFNTTANFLNMTGLFLALGSGANLTLLAPSDAAWRNVTRQPRGAELMKALKGPNAELVLINALLYHLIPEYYTSVTLLATTSDSPLPTLLGDSIFVSTAVGQSLFYSNITNKKDVAIDFAPDIYADYVVSIQGIDTVLIPKNISILYNPEALISIPVAAAPAGAPKAALAPAAAPTVATPLYSPPPTPSAAPKSSLSSSPPPPTSPTTTFPPQTASSAGSVAVSVVATVATLLVSVAALL